MRPLAALLAALAVLSPAAALAQAPSAGFRLPPPLPPGPEERPDREPDDIPRRRFELAGGASIAAIGCHGTAPKTADIADPCASLSPMNGGYLAVHHRPIPHFSLGILGSMSFFDWSTARTLGETASEGHARWTYIGLSARGYLFDSGRVDPYVGASVGAGYLSMTASHEGTSEQLWRASFASTGSVGVDVMISAHLRIGPFVEFLWQPGQAAERCTGGVCLDASSTLARMPEHALRGGLALTLAAGDEL
jgi:hypothetical protein